MSFVSYLLGSVMLFYNFLENTYCINVRYYKEFEFEIIISKNWSIRNYTIRSIEMTNNYLVLKLKILLSSPKKVKQHLRNSETNSLENDNQIIFERMWMVAWT